jgi:hypothetical protein
MIKTLLQRGVRRRSVADGLLWASRVGAARSVKLRNSWAKCREKSFYRKLWRM